jgi:hypothetical protein
VVSCGLLDFLLCSGGLEPHFRVPFSAIFQGVSLWNFRQAGNLWKWAEAKVWQIVVDLRTKFPFVLMILCIFTRMWRIPLARLFAQHHKTFDDADQIGPPDRGFNAGRAGGHANRHLYPVRGADALDRQYGDLPDARDDHLLRLTDSTGRVQHATFTIPNYRHGYCTDHNHNDCWASDEVYA